MSDLKPSELNQQQKLNELSLADLCAMLEYLDSNSLNVYGKSFGVRETIEAEIKKRGIDIFPELESVLK